MTSPDDPETTTRSRGESPQSDTGPVPSEPDDPLTHARGESPTTMTVRAARAARTEPTWPEPVETKSRGESPKGAVMTLPTPNPNPSPSPNRTNSRGESPGLLSGMTATSPNPIEPKTSNRGDSPEGLSGSLGKAGRPRPNPSPSPKPDRTFDRGEISSSLENCDGVALGKAPMTVLGVLAARQNSRR